MFDSGHRVFRNRGFPKSGNLSYRPFFPNTKPGFEKNDKNRRLRKPVFGRHSTAEYRTVVTGVLGPIVLEKFAYSLIMA